MTIGSGVLMGKGGGETGGETGLEEGGGRKIRDALVKVQGLGELGKGG